MCWEKLVSNSVYAFAIKISAQQIQLYRAGAGASDALGENEAHLHAAGIRAAVKEMIDRATN
jgi:hypothetical protein